MDMYVWRQRFGLEGRETKQELDELNWELRIERASVFD